MIHGHFKVEHNTPVLGPSIYHQLARVKTKRAAAHARSRAFLSAELLGIAPRRRAQATHYPSAAVGVHQVVDPSPTPAAAAASPEEGTAVLVAASPGERAPAEFGQDMGGGSCSVCKEAPSKYNCPSCRTP